MRKQHIPATTDDMLTYLDKHMATKHDVKQAAEHVIFQLHQDIRALKKHVDQLESWMHKLEREVHVLKEQKKS